MTSTTLRLLVLSLTAVVSAAQKTYVRSCDCEYMVDGKCAYTLLLPVQSSSAGTVNGVASDCDSQIRTSLQEASTNITFLWQWTANQTAILTQLQQAFISLQSQMIDSTKQSCGASASDSVVDSINRTLREQGELIATKTADIESRLEKLELLVNQTAQLAASNEDRISQLTTELAKLKMTPSSCNLKAALFAAFSSALPTASTNVSSVDGNLPFDPSSSRIDSTTAWCPSQPNSTDWIEYSIGPNRWIFGVVTKGRADSNQWVTKYQLEFRDTSDSNWTVYSDVLGNAVVFPGNTDSTTAVINYLWQPIFISHIRIVPLEANSVNEVRQNECMRADLVACVDDLIKPAS